jgi:hypothetical protein
MPGLATELCRHTDGQGYTRYDDAVIPFFARELEYVYARSFDIIRPDLKMANGQVIPIDSSPDTGAETYTYYQFDSVGIAKVIDSYAHKDIPQAAIKGAKFTANIVSLGEGYGYTIQDVRAARLANRPLTTMLSDAVRLGHDEAWHIIGLFGHDDSEIRGFVNHPNITVTDAPLNGAATSSLWEDKSPDEIIADINDMINAVRDTTNGVEQPTDVLLPLNQYTLIASTPRSSTSDTTILEFVRKNHPTVTFDWLNELAASKSFGELTEDVAIAYVKNTDKAALVIPQTFEQMPLDQDGMQFVIATHSRIGGATVRYPLSIHRYDGI